jgi:uncharacterized protein (DUF1697 family)
VAKYVAFLKAINVGGHVVTMEKLRELFSGMKFSNVETFIASGNVIFDTKAAPDQKLEEKIEKQLKKALGYDVATFVRSIEEIQAISVFQPFSKELLKTAHAVHVGFMRGALSAGVLEKAKSCASEADDFLVSGREVYWLCRISTAESKFPKQFEKSTGQTVTYRSVKTVVRLARRSQESGDRSQNRKNPPRRSYSDS